MRKLLLCLLLLCKICHAQLTCGNWLRTPDKLTGVSIGQLDVTGDQLTVEAVCNATDIYNLSRALVSKHKDPRDVNYFLCPDLAQITTTNGFFSVVSPCSFVSNKTYHVALVYNGSSLKLYRNGFLMQETPASGDLITNTWPATVGEYAYSMFTANAAISNIFKGYINEVRIWNVARTQQQIRNYMNSSLPSPATQTGLLAYYTFDDLVNKQGNSLFNATLNGASTINNTNPNCNFVADSCDAVVTSACNNWLSLPSNPSFVNVGDLDVPGDKITVEAVFFQTGTGSFEGDIVTKHNSPADVNYLLRANHAYITTNNGYFETPNICEAELNKRYHVAMVYDGSTLKFYRNGFLMSQVNATGNLFQNNWQTQIGWYAPQFWNSNFLGYVNEVRIWNVVRTQSEIRAHMDNSLPNPASQTGLLAYYTFDNLINKQGNTAWNGSLNGTASINNAVPNCNFTPDSCGTAVTSACNNWLHIPNYNTQDYVAIGDLDMTGDKITVEAQFAADTNYFIPSTVSYDLVSKHTGPSDCNYLLRPVTAEITTSNGFYQIIACDYKPKKINHAALVYDGSTLKFYRNGFLMGSKPASGNLITNDLITKIGNYSFGSLNGSLKGYMNEVRIWNIARTQDEIKTYMNASLPNPTTQPGLVAYYQFDNLSNKQGNAAWNGTLNGAATINNTVPDCNFIADSCITVTGTGGVINEYAAVLSFDICTNTMVVDDALKFNAGDTIVIMQMKGAAIDSSNSNAFGTISGYNNAGKYEFNYVKSKTGNTIEFANTILNNYDAVFGKVQLIRVPYFQTLTVSQTLTCPAWDGAKGGVLIVNSANDINLNAGIDVSSKGFRGGAVGGGFSCGNIDLWSAATGTGGTKGEGIAEYVAGFEAGGARLANGGGGAYAANSGGGGGGNYGAGGLGGFHSNTCPSTTQSINGEAINYSGNIVFLGGAGGGGQQDNSQPVAAGGNGGGIVMIKAATLNSNNQSIIANGESVTALVRDEGGGGGGAGGSVLLYVNNYTGTINIDAIGGDGSSNDNQIYPTRCHGPGGGGGGGYIGLSSASLPVNVNTSLNGGVAGMVLNAASACFNTSNGASNGVAGGFNLNLVLPEAKVPFKKNIDSVRINSNLINCKAFAFNGLGYTNARPIQNWQWSFGDGSIDSVQNPTHTYAAYGTNTIKLIATDINGCKDSISKTVTTNGINFDFVFEQDTCNPLSVSFRAVGDTTAEIYWSKGDGTITTTVRNPTHTYPGPGSYLVEYCTGNASTGCIDTVKKTIFIGWRDANIILTQDTTICYSTNKLLRSNIDSTLQFCWGPITFLNNASFANPTANTPSTITYSLVAASEENNLVTNGDFTTGGNGFTSDYNAGTKPLAAQEYIITPSTLNAGPLTANCPGHTTATGNMLVARNDFGTIAKVWEQTVTVQPNTNYAFTAWVQSLLSPNTVPLQLLINGNTVVDNIAMPATSCTWAKQHVLWNSGNNTTAKLSIANKSLLPGAGGYFAIDDISFAAYSIKRDTVKITVDTPFADTRTDTSICESASVELTTVGANAYSWAPATGLSNASVASPIATPANTTKYYVSGTSIFGCTATDSVTISIKTIPAVSSTGDTTICRNTAAPLFASGGASYSWEPAALLNNPNIANPVANPSAANTKYVVTVTGANNCSSKDSFVVAVTPVQVYSVSADTSVCLNTNAQLNATGGNYYLWSPASLVNNSNIPNPISTAINTTAYSVLVRDTICNFDTTLFTTITVLPSPTITAAKENDVDCTISSTNLLATGALQYNWSPITGLDDANSATPVASPVATTTYIVKGTGNNGCSDTASVTVFANKTGRPSYLVPNAFTPNGDGSNDCFRIKYFGLVQELEFIIYNRWGELVFFTSNPNACWDGTYKGKPCNAGSFVYFIKAKTGCGTVTRKGNLLLVR